MAQVVVTIAGRTYRMNCEDGQEPHLERLARDIDARMGDLRQSFGEIGDQRLVVMTALTIADELDGVRQRLKHLDEANAARVVELEGIIEATTARVIRLVEALEAAKE